MKEGLTILIRTSSFIEMIIMIALIIIGYALFTLTKYLANKIKYKIWKRKTKTNCV